MCGIFTASKKSRNATNDVLEGLKRLEYRGYDSWGIAVLDNNQITIDKKVGAIGKGETNLKETTMAIGHTRWATHGKVSRANAHPHLSSDKSFALVHNGIVENYDELKKKLVKTGYSFSTDTDTETIVASIEYYLQQKNSLQESARKAFLRLKGRNTITILSKNGTILGLRNGSPLVAGEGKKGGEYYLSSDTLSFAQMVNKIYVIDNGQMILCKDNKAQLFDIKTGETLPLKFEKTTLNMQSVELEGYDHFMLKEIYETPSAIRVLASQEKQNYASLAEAIKKSRRIYTIGSGTAGAAAAQIAYYLRKYGKINAQNLIGAETTEYIDLLTKEDLIIAPSQSGETADVIEVLEQAKERQVKIASIVNMPGSMITRLSDFPFMSQAGPEICVMTTKVFVSQIAWGYLLSQAVCGNFDAGSKNLKTLAEKVENYLQNSKNILQIKSLAKNLSGKKNIYLMSKAQNLAIVIEGMIKIIEGSYIHAHAIASGDLKHYAITLMEKDAVVIAVLSEDEVYDDIINAVHEVVARGADVIGISSKNSDLFKNHLPTIDLGQTSAIFNIIPIQLLAYYMSVALGNNVDRPRNIAKSVTVR